MNAHLLPDRARLLAAVCGICILLPITTGSAQTVPAEGPLPPPPEAPASRLTVTPAEFEQWLVGITPVDDTEMVEDQADAPPSLVTPPPPPPSLVTPPPPPVLVAPPAPQPTIAPVTKTVPAPAAPPAQSTPEVAAQTPAPLPPQPLAATTPTAPPAATTPASPTPDIADPAPAPVPLPPQPSGSAPDAPSQPPQPTLTAPPAPLLTVPDEPRVATLPPDSPDTTAPAQAPATGARPDGVKIIYPEGLLELPEAAKPDLVKIAAWLRQNPAVRVQIVGYASETASAGNQARRTSLFRTLAVRKYLVENGVLSTRMDVRALGDKTDELPRDRVEISLPPS